MKFLENLAKGYLAGCGYQNIEREEATIVMDAKPKYALLSFTEEQQFFLDHFQDLTLGELSQLVRNANHAGTVAAKMFKEKRQAEKGY